MQAETLLPIKDAAGRVSIHPPGQIKIKRREKHQKQSCGKPVERVFYVFLPFGHIVLIDVYHGRSVNSAHPDTFGKQETAYRHFYGKPETIQCPDIGQHRLIGLLLRRKNNLLDILMILGLLRLVLVLTMLGKLLLFLQLRRQ